MNIYTFAKKMFKATSKDSKFYIASIVVTMIFMFNTINISYNEAIYSTSEKTYTIMELVREPGSYDLKTVPFYYSAQEIQQKSLIIMFFVVIFFTSISSMDYIKKRTKETAFIVSNGSYILDVVRYVGYMGGKCFFLGGTIGIFAGIASIPIFNSIMYSLMGKTGPIFTISLEAIYLAIGYLFVQYLYLTMINFSYLFKKEIVELINAQNTVTFVDKRQFKYYNIIFVILYLAPILVLIKMLGSSVSGSLVNFISYAAAVGIYGIVVFISPKLGKRINLCNFMYKGTRKIYFSNFIYTLKNSLLYMLGVVLAITYYIALIVKFSFVDGMIEVSLFCMISNCIIIGIALLNRLLDETENKMPLYKSLKTLGYDKVNIFKIVSKEAVLVFTNVILLPLIIIITGIIAYVMEGAMAINIGISIIFMVVSPLVIASVVSIIINKRKVNERLYG